MSKPNVISVSLPEGFVEFVDVYCRKAHMGRSEFFREASKFYIEKKLKKVIKIADEIIRAGVEI